MVFAFSGLFIWYGFLLLGLVIGGIFFQLWRIWPYTPFSKKQVLNADPEDDRGYLSLTVCNVYQYNRKSQKLVESVRTVDTDLLLFLEADHWWDQQLTIFQETHPFHIRVPLSNTYGMVLYSRLPLSKPEVCYIMSEDVPSIHGYITVAGKGVELWLVHPKPPIPPESDSSLDRDAELLIIGRRIHQDQNPVIVAGDLNDVAWSYTTNLFQKASGLLDPRRGRGMFSTYNAKNLLFRWPLDHIFHSRHFKLMEMKRLSRTGSDHFPIFVKLSLNSDAVRKQEKMEFDGNDKEIMTRKIEKAT